MKASFYIHAFSVVLVLFLACPEGGLADGTITGQGRFEKIKGKPAAGYQYLYESNLFLSRDDGGIITPARRLGAPPGQTPRGDGYYSISVPAGSYSILVHQPLFFIRPKVVADLEIQDGRTTSQHVDLSIDYSTYFQETWDGGYSDTWYQTFVATGTSISGVSWKLAGTNANRIRALIHQDNGNPNPTTWPVVSIAAAKDDNSVAAGADNWVRWRSGQVPTTPGTVYAVKLTGISGGDRGFTLFHRPKDGNSYVGGQAYDGSGRAKAYDLNITVFSDNDGTAILYCKTTEGLGDLRDGYYGGRWGQTFRATRGISLAAVDVWAAGPDGDWDRDFTWTVKKGGPTGQQVGPVKTGKTGYQAAGVGLHGVSYNPGEVPLEPGDVYYVEFTHSEGFNPFVFNDAADVYPDGAAYQDGTAKDGGGADLSMTIIAYTGAGGTIRGTVRDATNGRALGGATVTVTTLGRSAITDASGDYEIPLVPEGDHDVRASMAGFTSGTEQGVSVVAGETVTVDFSLSRTACGHVFGNEGFESGLSSWTIYGGAKTSNPGPGWFGGIDPKEGGRFWGNEVNGTGLGMGGAYQRFCGEPGHRYRATAWSNIYWIGGNSNTSRSRIGLHSAGGTAADASVTWSSWDRQSQEATEGWRKLQVEAEAAGTVLTLFLDFDQQPEGEWHISCFDAVEIEDLDANASPLFDRGDCNNDQVMDITDAVFLLAYLFQGGSSPLCLSACDSNDDGVADISDAVAGLGYLFLGQTAPPPPHGSCGVDLTPDELECAAFDC